MSYKDTSLLQEAYLSVLKKRITVPSDEEKVTPYANSSVSTSPVRELAPSPEIEDDYSEDEDSQEEHDTTGTPVSMEIHNHKGSTMHGDGRFSVNDEDEEDDMTIDNVHAIKESLLKIAIAVTSGIHLEPWQQQKLAIVMDNLASIARSLPRQSCEC